jgi:signal transduction histidine kinase
MFSHEMRTPLTSILGFSQILAAGAAEAEDTRADMIESIYVSAERLTHAVDALLWLLQHHTSPPDPAGEAEPIRFVDLFQLAAQTAGEVQSRAQVRSVDLSVRAPRPFPLRIDSSGVRCALRLLFDLAVTESQKDSTVRVRVRDHDTEARTCLFLRFPIRPQTALRGAASEASPPPSSTGSRGHVRVAVLELLLHTLNATLSVTTEDDIGCLTVSFPRPGPAGSIQQAA